MLNWDWRDAQGASLLWFCSVLEVYLVMHEEADHDAISFTSHSDWCLSCA